MELLSKPDWEITATTVYCDAVGDEVTLIVYADGTSRCTGRQKYAKPEKKTSRTTEKKNRRQGKQPGCRENDCSRVSQYRDSLLNSKTEKL
jgi:hypothetical protein